MIQWRICQIIFWSASSAVFEIWNTVSFTVGGKEIIGVIKELLWVVHNKRCIFPTSLWIDTILEAKYSPKSCLLSYYTGSKSGNCVEREHRQLSVTYLYLTNLILFWFALLNCFWNNDQIQHLTYQSLKLNRWHNCKTQLHIHSYLLTHLKVYAILAMLL